MPTPHEQIASSPASSPSTSPLLNSITMDPMALHRSQHPVPSSDVCSSSGGGVGVAAAQSSTTSTITTTAAAGEQQHHPSDTPHTPPAAYDQTLLEEYIDEQHQRAAMLLEASHHHQHRHQHGRRQSCEELVDQQAPMLIVSGPSEVKQRLHMWFEAIENEFDRLLEQNLELSRRLSKYEPVESSLLSSSSTSAVTPAAAAAATGEVMTVGCTPASASAAHQLITQHDIGLLSLPVSQTETTAAAVDGATDGIGAATGDVADASMTAANAANASASASASRNTKINLRKLPSLQQALFHGVHNSKGGDLSSSSSFAQNKITGSTQKIAERVRQFGSKFKITKGSGGSGGGGAGGGVNSSAVTPTGGDILSESVMDNTSSIAATAVDTSRSKIRRRYLYHPDIVFNVQCAAIDLDLADASRHEPYYIFSASADKTVAIWSQSLANPVCIYTGHRGAVNAVRVNEASGVACSVSGDRTCHLWRMNDLYNDDSSTDMSKLVTSASFSQLTDMMSDDDDDDEGADGDTLDDLSIDSNDDLADDTIARKRQHAYPLNQPVISSRRLQSLDGHTSVVSSCDWMSNAKVVTASWDGKLRVFNAEKGGAPAVVIDNDEDSAVNRVACRHQNEDVFASCSMGNTVKLWDTRSPDHLVHVFKGHSDQVSAIVFANNDRFFFSGSEDGVLKFWDLRKMGTTSHAMKTINCHSGINDISVSAYHSRIVVATNKRTVRIFDITGQNIQNLQKHGHRLMVTSVAWSPDGNHVYSSSTDRTLIQWNML